jgi:hypothetical protein
MAFALLPFPLLLADDLRDDDCLLGPFRDDDRLARGGAGL